MIGLATPARTGRPAPPVATPMGMASAHAPPFSLPGGHFAAALVFLLAGVTGAVVVAPELAQGFYPSQRVIGVTHLFTLGWITTSIMGALYQFLPVALGQPIRSVGVARTTLLLYAPGVAAFVAGLITGRPGLFLGGAATFGTGVLLFVWNLAATLRRAERRDVTWWALAAADLFLFTTLLLGLLLAGNLRWGYLGGGRFEAVGTHLHIALGGWVLLVMVGVANRLLPMFLLSHGAGDRFAKVAVACLGSGALILATLHHAPPLVSRWIPAALLATGLIAFLLQACAFYRHRHRPRLDPGMRLAAAGLVLLAVGLPFAAQVIITGASPRVATAYVLVVVVGISVFVAAHYYKIVPFLVWYHRFGPLAGRRPVPRVSELFSARWATVAGGLLVIGAAGLTAAVATGTGGVARMAAVVLGAGVVIETLQMLQLARRQP